MSNYYAQINENNIVFAISQLHSMEKSSNLIPLNFNDTSLMGATYDPILKKFTRAAPKAPEPNQQLAALDALMSGQIGTATQTFDANDAVMNAMIDIQAQLDAIKTKLGVV